MPEAGVKINGKHYAFPSSFRLGELREIKRITGLNPPEFTKALNSLDKTSDPDVLAGMVWWIMHRDDPSFTVADLDEIELSEIEGEASDEATPVDPKGEGAMSASLPVSVDASSISLDATGETSHANGGAPALAHFGPAT